MAYSDFMGDVGMEDHQICIAHMLRNLIYTMQAFLDDAWSLDCWTCWETPSTEGAKETSDRKLEDGEEA